MDFRQLRSFTAVVENKSFSKAAEKLHSAQPTISTHVRMLEEELNTRLILRTTKTIEVTPQGWEAYKYAVKILDLRDCITQSCSADSKYIIRVGASTVPATYVIPDILPQYTENNPDTYFQIHQSNSHDVVEGVMDGRFDVGLIGIPADKEGLTCVPFCNNRIVLITPVNEAYLALQRVPRTPLKQLLQNPIILREKGGKKTADRFLDNMGIREEDLNVVARVNDQEAVKNLVAKGMGVSLISEIAARDFIRERRLLQFRLPQDQGQQKLYLIYRSRFTAQPKVQNFINFLNHCEVP
ncbi:MAG: LysR family transcriptional regulator [Oscillospiraceae bacterium]|nr:LysR family transcriptional regulator [Oscillospiraceae bacterium]